MDQTEREAESVMMETGLIEEGFIGIVADITGLHFLQFTLRVQGPKH